MKVKVSEASGATLDWMVSTAEGWEYDDVANAARDDRNKKYSTKWAQGGPIIERERLCVGHTHQADPEYCPINDPATNGWARTTAGGYLSYGPTPLIAAMRCYVASKLGEEVEVPDELS